MIDKHKVLQVKETEVIQTCKIIKPEVDVIEIIMTSDWRFKRGLMVPGGLSFSKVKPPTLILKVQI